MTTRSPQGLHPPLSGRRALFVSWVAHHGRSEDLAAALGAECIFIAVGRPRNPRTALFRHSWQGVRTLLVLVRRRPRILIVMAPPAALVFLGLVWCRLCGAKLVVDLHSKAVLGRPLSLRLAEHATLCLVTIPSLAQGLDRAIPVHDPPATAVSAPRHDEVVFPASWASDEPVTDLLAAIRALPEVRFAITGRPPPHVVLPDNLRLTGHLPQADYLALVAGAPVVLALTTRESTMQRAAYEAVAAGRPIVASDTQALRSYLGEAACYAGDLREALVDALDRLPELEAACARLRDEQEQAFAGSVAAIAAALT